MSCHRRAAWLLVPVVFAFACSLPARLVAEDPQGLPLHERIDRLVEGRLVGPPAPVCRDEEFLRRIYLDLTGRLPPVQQTRAFLADASPGKRARLVDELLASPQFTIHFASYLDVLLMERLPQKHVPVADWRNWLIDSVAAGKPLNVMVREMLEADGTDPNTRPAARFYLDREAEAHRLTRDVGRLFLGRDLQCAQCHDHPLVSDYYQSDYYGLYAFFSRTFLFTDKKNKLTVLAEKAEGEVTYKSAFTGEEGKTGPRIFDGPPVQEPTFPKGEEYAVKPDKDVRPVPKFSRRLQLAPLLASGQNVYFNRNWANRLWAYMMGRGLVHPVDLHSADNPPAIPELLDLLAAELVRMNYDVRAMLRELALTRTYQRSFDMPGDLVPAGRRLKEHLAELEKEVEAARAALETAGRQRQEAQNAWEQAVQQVRQQEEALAAQSKALEAAQQQAQQAAQTLQQAREGVEELSRKVQVVAQAADAAAQAASQLPQETILVQAAQTLQGRRDELAKELEAKKQAEAAAAKAHQQAAATLQQAQTNHQAAQTALNQAQQKRDQLAARVRQLDQEMAACDLRLQQAKVRLEDARALVQLAEETDALAAARQQQRRLEGELAEAQKRIGPLQSQLAELPEKIAAAEKQLQQAAAQHGQLQEQLQAAQQAAELYQQVLQRTEQARKLLPEDQSLGQTLTAMQQRLQQLNQRCTDLSAQLQQHEQTLQQFQSQLDQQQQQQQQVEAALAELKEQIPAWEKELKDTTERIESLQQNVQNAREELAQRWTERFAVAPLKPLTPEQLAWSLMSATGVVQRQEAASLAELKKAAVEAAKKAGKELSGDPEIDPLQLQRHVAQKLQGQVDQFVRLFGSVAGQPEGEFFATPDQALFLANAGTVLSWLNPTGDNVTARALKLEKPEEIAQELYLSLLVRLPTAEEVELVRKALQERPNEKQAVIRDIAWGLVASAEFRFNH